eukprot:gene12438-6190_t
MSFEDDDEEEFSSIYKILTEQTGKKQEKLIVQEIKTNKEKNVKLLKLSSFEECNEKYVELWKIKNIKTTGLVPIEKIFKKDDQDLIYIVTNQYQKYEFQDKLLSEDLLVEYFYQLISTLATLHEKGFVFPFDAILIENIYKMDDKVMFDVFSSLEEEIQHQNYFPPEFSQNPKNNTKEGNVYNLGLVFFLMSCQLTLDKLPLHVKNVDIKDFILKKLELDSYLLIQDFILNMLEDEPSKRMTAKECEVKLNKLRQRAKKKSSSLLSLRNYKEERNSSPTPSSTRDFQEIEQIEIEDDTEVQEDEEEKRKKNNRMKRQSLSNLLRQKIGNIIESPNKTPSPSSRSPVTPVENVLYEKISSSAEATERSTLENLPLLTQGNLKFHTGSLISPWKSKYYYLALDFLYDETSNKLTGKISMKQVMSIKTSDFYVNQMKKKKNG